MLIDISTFSHRRITLQIERRVSISEVFYTLKEVEHEFVTEESKLAGDLGIIVNFEDLIPKLELRGYQVFILE